MSEPTIYFIPPTDPYYHLAEFSLGLSRNNWSFLFTELYSRIGQCSFATIWFGLPMPNTSTGAKVCDIHTAKAYVEYWHPFIGTSKECEIPTYTIEQTLQRINDYVEKTYWLNNPFRNNSTESKYIPITL